MTQQKKTMPGRIKQLTMFLFLVPLLNVNAFANHKTTTSTALNSLNLQHEPIQPMPPAEGLTPAKVTLGEADAISNGEKKIITGLKRIAALPATRAVMCVATCS